MTFEGATAIVTGGASGIGLSIARQLVEQGASVTIVGRNATKGQAAVREIEGNGAPAGHIQFAKADVTDFDALKAVADEVVRSAGRIDYMFNNAGITLVGEARDLSIRDWREVIDIDLMGVVNGIAAVYPAMVEQRRGHIVNTASLSGLFPTPGFVPYSAAKHGVVGLSQALRVEGAPHGVRVSVACPPLVKTPIVEATRGIRIDPAKAAEALKGPSMTPDDCARVILIGVRKNRELIMPGAAKPLAFIHRYAPFLTAMMSRSIGKQVAALREQDAH